MNSKNTNYKQTEIGEIPEDWNRVKISELCTITRGASPRPIQAFISKKGTPWVKISDATSSDSRYITSTGEFIIEEGESKSRVVYPGDFILSNSATPGLPRILKIRACIHDGWLLLRDFKNIDKNFLYYLLLTQREQLVMQGNGSVFTNLKTDILKNHVVSIPELDEQQQIASILSSLDDKIELNRRMNKTLEEIGKALFNRWFVNFEFPNENGEPYKSSGGEMVDSELGLIPKGWNASRVGEIATLKSGFAFKGSSFKDSGKYGVIKIKNVIDPGVDVMDIQFVSEEEVKDSARQFILNSGDILIAMSGNTTGKIGILVKGDYELVLNQRVGKYFLKNTSYHWYLYFLLRSGDIQKSIVEKAYGSAQPNISPSLLEDITLLIPDNNVLKKFNDISSHLMKSYIKNYTEKIKLIKLRDSLLPRLMSGRIRVN